MLQMNTRTLDVHLRFLSMKRFNATALMPNHSLNRTHCGVRPKARHFILGF